MKLAVFLISCFLLLSHNSFSQSFAPLGATWHYTENFAFSSNQSFLKIESTQDSLFMTKNCKLLVKNKEIDCEARPLQVLVYEQDSVVYFWDESFNEFQILYDLKKQLNESWIIKIKELDQSVDTIVVTVTSSYQTTINSINLKVIDVEYSVNYANNAGLNVWNSKIIQSIGDTEFLFNLKSINNSFCDANYSSGLRCYEDNEIGFYSTLNQQECEYDNLSVNSLVKDLDVSVFPNPTKNELTVNLGSNNSTISSTLRDVFGKLINQQSLFNVSTFKIDLSKEAQGIYFLAIENEKSREIIKIIKE
jgi:hypothetical protein